MLGTGIRNGFGECSGQSPAFAVGLRQELSISSQHPAPRQEALPHARHTLRFPSHTTGDWLCVHWIRIGL